MRKIRVFSKSASGESANTEAAMMDAIEKWQAEHPNCRIANHNIAFLPAANPRFFLTIEFDDPDA